MATSYADPFDVALRINTEFTGDETSQCEALLEDVSEIMRARLPALDTWIADGKVTAGLAKAVACELARQAITVADTGFGVKQETHPEHSVTFTDAATAGLDLTDRQIDLLTPANLKSRGRAFNIHPG